MTFLLGTDTQLSDDSIGENIRYFLDVMYPRSNVMPLLRLIHTGLQMLLRDCRLRTAEDEVPAGSGVFLAKRCLDSSPLNFFVT